MYGTIRGRRYNSKPCPSCVVGQMKNQHKVRPADFVAKPEQVSFGSSDTSNGDMVQTTVHLTVPLTFAPLSVTPSEDAILDIEKNVLVSCDYSGRIPPCHNGLLRS